MKKYGFKSIIALVAVLFGLSASNVMAQSNYQYLISDQQEAAEPEPAVQETNQQVNEAVEEVKLSAQ